MTTSARTGDEKLAQRLESFSDLVFGFSLSLLAIRLDVPARIEETFEPTRWIAVIVTFFLICKLWLEHHRVFRHRFAVQKLDQVLIFIFLFAIAILPYAVQTFLRFSVHLTSLSLYVGDLIIVLLCLSILRVRGLRQRRNDPDVAERAKDWRHSAATITGALLAAALLAVLHRAGATFESDVQNVFAYAFTGIAILVVIVRFSVRGLPGFLRSDNSSAPR